MWDDNLHKPFCNHLWIDHHIKNHPNPKQSSTTTVYSKKMIWINTGHNIRR